MSRLPKTSPIKGRVVFAVLLGLLLASCSSPEERAQKYYDNGMKYLAAHEDQKAAVEFRNALRLRKDLLPAWRGLAQASEATAQWDVVIPVLRTILDLDPKDDSTRIKLARLLVARGAVDQSLKLVNEISDQKPNDAGLLALKAIIFFRLKDTDTAIRNAQAALKIEPGNAEALVVLGADRLANNDPKGALALLSQAKKEDHDIGLELFKLRAVAQMKDYPELESLLKDLSARYPQNAAFRKDLVDLYLFQHRNDDAEKELRAVVATDPKNLQANMDLIRFLYTVRGPGAAHDELISRINAGGDNFPYQLTLAEFDFDQGHVDDSFKQLNTLANSTSLTQTQIATAKVMLAELNFRRKDDATAEKIVDNVLSNDPHNVDALKLRASIRLSRDQADAAIADLRGALNEQPRSTDLMLMLATAYERSGSIELADKQFADAMKASNFNANVGLEYVAFLRRRGGSDRANDVLAELANRWPRDTRVLTALAQAKLARQDWAGAQQIAEAIKRIGNSDVLADQILGAALSGEHKYDASIEALKSAVAGAPSSPQPMVALVATMVQAKQTDRAIAFLQSVLKENPKSAEAYILLGNVQLTNNSFDEAEKNFKAAIQILPKNESGYQALATLYLKEKKLDAANDVIQNALKDLPDAQNLHLTLANIREIKGDYDGAISEYDNLLKLQPGSLVVINNLASMLADHRADKASLDRAKSLAASLRSSQVPQFKDTEGWVDYRQGDMKAAVPLLEAAAANMPNSPLVHYHLGMSYLGSGQAAKASDQLKQALSQAPDGDLEAKIKAGLKDVATQ